MFNDKIYSQKMDKTIEVFSKELTSLRTGRANASMLDLVKVDVYGDEKILSKYLNLFDSGISRNLKIIHTDEKVLSEDSPSHALRHKKNSSMSMAIKSVKDKNAQACVSAGNTGALMAISRFILGTLDGIDRPAIESMLPSLNGHTHVLDLGANIDSKAEHLYQRHQKKGVPRRAKLFANIARLNRRTRPIRGLVNYLNSNKFFRKFPSILILRLLFVRQNFLSIV